MNFSFFVFTVLSAAADVYVSPRPPSSARCVSHGATAAAFQGIPFVAATNGVLVRVRVCTCLCATLNTTLTSSEFQKHPCSTRTLHILPNSNERCNKQRTSHRPTYISQVRRTTCVPPFQHVIPSGFETNYMPKGNLCVYILKIPRLFMVGFFLTVQCGLVRFTKPHRTVRCCLYQNRNAPHRRILEKNNLHRTGP